jgi:hypothetical protein
MKSLLRPTVRKQSSYAFGFGPDVVVSDVVMPVLGGLDMVLQETERFCCPRQEEVAKIVHCGDIGRED